MAQVVSKRDSSVMLRNGEVAGYWIWEITKTDNQILMNDISVLTGIVREDLSGKIERDGLYTSSLNINMEMGPNLLKVDSKRDSPTHLKAVIEISGEMNRSKSVDTVYIAAVIQREEVFALVQALPLKKGLSLSGDVLFSDRAATSRMKLEVTGEEIVRVPAGTFDCYKIEFTGGEPSNTIYVSKATPRRIVKVDVLGQPLTLELAGSSLD